MAMSGVERGREVVLPRDELNDRLPPPEGRSPSYTHLKGTHLKGMLSTHLKGMLPPSEPKSGSELATSSSIQGAYKAEGKAKWRLVNRQAGLNTRTGEGEL